MWKGKCSIYTYVFRHELCASREGNVGPPLWSRQKYLNNYWLDFAQAQSQENKAL